MPRLADCGASVIVDRHSPMATTASMDTVTKAMAMTVRQPTCTGDSTDPDTLTMACEIGALPSRSRPTKKPTNATLTTATTTNTDTETSFRTSNLVRPTGRTSRYRSVPAWASPATASPAATATATGRNNGSTIASAAMPNSEPLAVTADRNAGPWPGRGAIPVQARSPATMVGSRLSSPTASHVLRRPNSLRSSTSISAAPPSGHGRWCARR